jgi:hypothetical protein
MSEYVKIKSGSIPTNYQEIQHWSISEKPIRIVLLQIFGLLLFFIFGLIFSFLAFRIGKMPVTGEITLSNIGIVVIAILLTFIVHELTHGIVMQLFGAKPKYGVLWNKLVFFATSPGYAYTRNNYVLIALAPFVLFSIAAVMGMWILNGTLWVALLGICGTINASGAIGDLWITVIVLHHNKESFIIDEKDGIRIYLPNIKVP